MAFLGTAVQCQGQFPAVGTDARWPDRLAGVVRGLDGEEATASLQTPSGAGGEADLPAYFHACDVYCLSSIATAEAFGIVQAEAMVCGKPVVNTWLHNGVNALAPDGLCALTVQPGDAAALSAALNQVLADPAPAHRLGEAGRARVLQSFSVEAMVNQTLALYQSLI